MYVNFIEWHTHPFRSDRWYEAWSPALDRALSFGASASYLTRNIDDPLHFRQVSFWERKEDFERFWASDEITALRELALNYFNKPVLPVWHNLVADTAPAAPSSDEGDEPVAAEASA